MKLKVWGSRGSITTPKNPEDIEEKVRDSLNAFFDAGYSSRDHTEVFLANQPQHKLGGYGGETLCVQVSGADDEDLIIDAGSGIRPFGYSKMAGPWGQGKGEIHLLFTHFHWDHICGLGFFIPLYIPGNKVHLYAVQPELEQMMQTIFQKPFFPVTTDDLGSEIIYHQLEPRTEVDINGFKVTPYELDHPDPCWGYRVEKDGKVFSHCSDSEATRITEKDLGDDLPLYHDVDVALVDAQFGLSDWVEKMNWGHASAPVVLELLMTNNVKKVFFLHHDPTASDEKVREAELAPREYYEKQLKQGRESGIEYNTVDWSYAYDGLEIEV